MSNITIEDVTKIIFDIKEKHNIQDKNFEIFALAAVLDELKMEDFYNLSILRTSGDKYEEDYAFQLQFPTNTNTFGRFDKDAKKFVALYDRSGHKSNSHAVHTDKEMGMLKDIYNVFANNTSFDDFKKDFTNNLSEKIDRDYKVDLENLYSKSFDFSKLMFIKHLKEVLTIDTLTDRMDKMDIAFNLFRSGLSRLNSITESDYSPEDGLYMAVSTDSLDEKLHSRNFENLLKFDTLVSHSRSVNHAGGDYISDDDVVKIKQLLETDYVKNNTMSGIILDDKITLSEKLFKIVSLHYEELRDDFMNSLENVTLLKTREKMSANFHIDEIKSKILEEFPTAFNDKNLTAIKSVTTGEFSNDQAESAKIYFQYLRNLKPFGLIRGVDLITASHSALNHDAFFEESYTNANLVILKSVNEVETLYQYTFKEFDIYGVKLLEPKDVYISKELGHGGFNDSLHDLIQYARENNCILVTSENIDDSLLFGTFGNHLSSYEYENVVFYDRSDRSEKNHLNTTLGLQKEFGKKMTFDDHIKIKELINNNTYIDTDELIEKGKDIIKDKKKNKVKMNGPN